MSYALNHGTSQPPYANGHVNNTTRAHTHTCTHAHRDAQLSTPGLAFCARVSARQGRAPAATDLPEAPAITTDAPVMKDPRQR